MDKLERPEYQIVADKWIIEKLSSKIVNGKMSLFLVHDTGKDFNGKCITFKVFIDKCESNKNDVLGYYSNLSTAKRLRTFWSHRLRAVSITEMVMRVVDVIVEAGADGQYSFNNEGRVA